MNNNFLVLALLIAGAIILWLWSRTSSLTQEVAKSQGEVNRISSRIQQEAMAQFQAWRQKEYDTLKNQEAEVADREAQVKLAQWKVVSEAGFRADAIQRSQSVIVGKVTEHIVPYLPEFSYNPKDARFIGSPVDFVVFDGLDRGAVGQVVFIEVKTGSGSLTKRERLVRDAVLAKNVIWEEMRIVPPDGSVVAVEAATATAATPAADSTAIHTCPKCGAQNRVLLEHCGRTIRCGSCKEELITRLVLPGSND
jgi:predicted Holliday junction resolvase-like endonuclease